MNYAEFLQPFYNSKKEQSGLKGVRSQGEVARFFVELPFNESVPDEFVYTPDTYRKWFTGINSPKPSFWKEIKKIFDESFFKEKLTRKINDANLDKIAQGFDIVLLEDTRVNKSHLVEAVTMQFSALVDGNGEAEDIVNKIYSSKRIPSAHSEYIRKTIDQYERMTILGGTECTLDECYICNNIGTRPEVFSTQNTIKDATLETLLNFDRRGKVNNILLIGGGGSGKTLMLQHLFVDAAKHYDETSKLPVFVELKEFSFDHKDIFDTIVEIVGNMDETFSKDEVHNLLSAGKCQLLLDGVDEINPSDIKDFQRKMMKFLKKYSDNQVIMTSRFSDAYKGVKGFVPLYMLPFDSKQSKLLIDRLMSYAKPDEKDKVIKCIRKGFIKKDGAFVSNPMMLTFLINNYQKLETNSNTKYLFYKEAYNAIVLEHDNEKIAYDRVYHSVSDPKEFLELFSEFCALTFKLGVFEFNRASFEKYFKLLKKKTEVSNPRILTCEKFLYDACSTACMMIETSTGIIYIDPGFQEFMFAHYYSECNPAEMKKLYEQLLNEKYEKYGRWTAFLMLREIAREKMDILILLPFLSHIFENKNDEEAFLSFLTLGFDQIVYSVLNKDLVDSYRAFGKIMMQVNGRYQNAPKNVVMAIALRMSKAPFYNALRTFEKSAFIEKYATGVFVGRNIDTKLNNDSPNILLLENKSISEMNVMAHEYKETEEQYIYDENGMLEFGFECTIPTSLFMEDSELKTHVIPVIGKEEETLWSSFQKLKELYIEVSEEQERYKFIEYDLFYGKGKNE